MRIPARHVVVAAALGVLPLGGAAVQGAAAAPNGTRAVQSALAFGARTARERRMAAVIATWSVRLNAGDNTGLAELFSLPATIIQAPLVYRLVTRAEVARWYAELPCSGRITSISYSGNFATAVFVLGNRGSTRCDGPGALAAARFEILDGKIASWEQVPVPPKQVAGVA